MILDILVSLVEHIYQPVLTSTRYIAVRSLKDRRELFDEFCKEKLRLVRLARKAALDAAGGLKADVSAIQSLGSTDADSSFRSLSRHIANC